MRVAQGSQIRCERAGPRRTQAVPVLISIAVFASLSPSFAMRAQGQESPAQAQGLREDARVRRWRADFQSPSAAKRNATTWSLIAAGPRVKPENYDALERKHSEVRQRAEYVAQALQTQTAKQCDLKFEVEWGQNE